MSKKTRFTDTELKEFRSLIEEKIDYKGFIFIGLIAFSYWMIQLKKFDDNKEEDTSITAHDYL